VAAASIAMSDWDGKSVFGAGLVIDTSAPGSQES
jgi:hypothetical protein